MIHQNEQVVSLSNGRINQNLIFKVIHSGNCDQNEHKNLGIYEYKQGVREDCKCTLVQATFRKHILVISKKSIYIHKPFKKKTNKPPSAGIQRAVAKTKAQSPNGHQ